MGPTQDQTSINIEQVYLDFFNAAESRAFKFTQSSIDAEYIVYSSYFKLKEQLPALRSQRHAINYFFTIVQNKCIDHKRRQAKRKEILEEYARSIPANQDPQYPETDLITLLLGQLSPKHQEIFRRHALEGYSFKEISGQVGCTPAAARKMYHRIREHLKSKIKTTIKTGIITHSKNK